MSWGDKLDTLCLATFHLEERAGEWFLVVDDIEGINIPGGDISLFGMDSRDPSDAAMGPSGSRVNGLGRQWGNDREPAAKGLDLQAWHRPSRQRRLRRPSVASDPLADTFQQDSMDLACTFNRM